MGCLLFHLTKRRLCGECKNSAGTRLNQGPGGLLVAAGWKRVRGVKHSEAGSGGSEQQGLPSPSVSVTQIQVAPKPQRGEVS